MTSFIVRIVSLPEDDLRMVLKLSRYLGLAILFLLVGAFGFEVGFLRVLSMVLFWLLFLTICHGASTGFLDFNNSFNKVVVGKKSGLFELSSAVVLSSCTLIILVVSLELLAFANPPVFFSLVVFFVIFRILIRYVRYR